MFPLLLKTPVKAIVVNKLTRLIKEVLFSFNHALRNWYKLAVSDQSLLCVL